MSPPTSADHQVSYWHMPIVKPFQWLTIPKIIDHWAEKRPQEEAYVVHMNGKPREAVTFLQLKQKTEHLAAGLLEMGMSPGDFVMITGITCMNWILVDLACESIGIHTIRCRSSILTKEGLLTIINANSVKALFYHPGEEGELEQHLAGCIPDMFQQSSGDHKLFEDVPSLKHVISLSSIVSPNSKVKIVDDIFSSWSSQDEIQALRSKVQPDTIATVFMTSGSTGFPKAIPYTHFCLLNLFQHFSFFRKLLRQGDRYFNERSLAWMGGFMHLSIAHGICNVFVHPMLHAKNNDADFAIKVIREENVTCGLFIQYLVADITDWIQQNKTVPFHLRWATTGGDVILPSTIENLGKIASNIAVGYGCTEVVTLAAFTEIKDVQTYSHHVGFVEPGTEVKIIGEDGDVVPLGEEGEIVVRNPFAFRGYLQNEAKGMEIDSNGWIKTDDAGCLEAGGLLKVFGRKSHVISRGIEIIYPVVVERIIAQFYGVSKVSVFGVPDKRLGQNICACILPVQGITLTSDDMQQAFDKVHMSDEGLGMTPAYFMFVETLPTVNGKPDKKKLQSIAIKEFGL